MMTSGQTAPVDSPESRETIHFERERGVTEIAVQRGITHVTVRLPEENLAWGRLALLRRLADANVPVFLVKLLPIGISFALREGQAEAGRTELEAAAGQMPLEMTVMDGLGLVTTRAGAMRDLSGVMSAIYQVLTTESVAVHQTGDAYNAVHCLVPGESADRAAEALRAWFMSVTPTPEPE